VSRRIPRVKRIEVASQYLLGDNYREIEEETGVSHGSIVNIIRELEKGELAIDGAANEQVDDLRQLAVELKSSGLKPAQAMNGIRFYKRLTEMEITPKDLECWSNIVREIRNADFQLRDFVEATRRLRELEKSQGKTFEELAEEYQKYHGEIERLRKAVSSLEKNKVALSDLTGKLSKESEGLKKQKEILANQVEMQATKLRDSKSGLAEAVKEKSVLQQEINQLQRRKVKISSEIDGREESLRDLSEIGFSNEDLLRLRGFLERISQSGNGNLGQVKEDFFSALVSYKDTLGLNRKRDLESQKIKELNKQEAMLTGSISQLENAKAELLGELDKGIVATLEKIKEAGEESALQLGQQLDVMKKQFDNLLADVLATGEAIGMMRNNVKEGECSQEGLKDFINEVRSRLGGKVI